MNLVDQLGASAGVQVEVRSAHGPWFAWTPTAGDAPAVAPEPSGPESIGAKLKRWTLAFFKPEVIIRSNFGTVDKAPGGKPTGTTWPLVPLVLGGLLVLGLVLAVAGLASLLRK
jgi:hypothetical protein